MFLGQIDCEDKRLKLCSYFSADSTNAAAAVAQAAINKSLAAKGTPQQKKVSLHTMKNRNTFCCLSFALINGGFIDFVQGQSKEPPQAPTQEQIAAQDYPTYRMYSTKFDIFSKNCIGVLHNLEPMSSLNGDLGVEVVPKKNPLTFCL